VTVATVNLHDVIIIDKLVHKCSKRSIPKGLMHF